MNTSDTEKWENELENLVQWETPEHEKEVKAFIHQTRQEAILEGERNARCKKIVEGDAICDVKLDCHVHDWRTLPVTETEPKPLPDRADEGCGEIITSRV